MKKTLKIPFILVLILLGTGVFAQPTDPLGDPGQAAAPINEFIIPMLIAVLVFGHQVLVKKENVQND